MLAYGADRFVDSALFLSARMDISPMIIGIVVVGFATSAPELLVSIIAALESHPTLSIGNAIGSNIANIGLVLGLTALVCPLQIKSTVLKFEYPLMVLGLLLATFLMFDQKIGYLDGSLMILGLFILLSVMVLAGNRSVKLNTSIEEASLTPGKRSTEGLKKAVFWFFAGLILLLSGSELLVKGAVFLARYIGVTDVFIGLTIVAVGTSLPELAASLAGAFKKETDLAIGNIIGSNLFNALGVVAMPALIKPFNIDRIILLRDVGSMWLMTALLLILIGLQSNRSDLGRTGGGILLLSFFCYQIILFFE